MQAINNDFLDKLKNYNFPGNVRELKNIIKRAIILTDGEVLKSSSLPNEFFEQKEFKNLVSNSVKLNEIEKHHILKILDKTHGNKTRAARMLGIGLTTLYRKLHTYNLE